MFHEIPEPIAAVMHHLETIDTRDRTDGTERRKRLRQIPPETGRFLALQAAMAPEGRYIEIGTSAGYSTLWLALACRQVGRKVTTFELLDDKAALARETFELAGVQDVVEFVHGDALEHLPNCTDVSFCFLDTEKELYADCYEIVVKNMIAGGVLVADNAINHAPTLQPMLDRALADERVDAVILPVGKGELLCRKK